MRAFISASSLITASRLTVGVTEGLAVVVVAAGSAGLVALAAVAGDEESLDFVAGFVSAPGTAGTSTDAVCTVGPLRAGSCACAMNGVIPQHTIATAGTAFQGMLVIQPLTFTKDFGMKAFGTPSGRQGSPRCSTGISVEPGLIPGPQVERRTWLVEARSHFAC
jgi:hypothetical protein